MTQSNYHLHMSWRGALAVLLLIACTKKNPVLLCQNGTCSDPQYPFCDIDGAVAGDPGACIAVSCSPNTFAACDGEDAITCDAAGTNYNTQHCINGCSAQSSGCNVCAPNMSTCTSDGTLHVCDAQGHDTPTGCAAGCIDTPTPHCGYVSPNYLPNVCDTPAQGALNVTNNQTLDTSVDSTCDVIVPQNGGPDICVVHRRSMTVAQGTTLGVVASTQGPDPKNRPVAFVTDDDLIIVGTLDAAARGYRSATHSNGPGGGYINEANGDGSMGGAGGAGFATHGGNGGSSLADGGAQNAGAQLPNPLTRAFVGGPSSYGPGGGGVVLVSCRGTVNISGVISLGGGGGPSGYFINGFCFPGFGGGAGGNLLVEGMKVDVTGSLYANGGGGGAGCVPSTQATTDQHGQDGTLSDVFSATGGAAVTGGGSGGAGGIGPNVPGDGRRSTVSGDNPGGGGGSVGWIQIGTPTGTTPTLSPMAVSPPIQANVPVSVH